MSRTYNSVRNIIFGFINKIVLLVFPFIIRSIIITKLGSEYLGLDGLFISILQVLNLVEMGFSNAIVYSLYKPIADKDTKTICSLINLFRKIYRYIGLIIIGIGLIILPFIPYLIKGSYPNDINIYILYLIYLFNTGLTYFLFEYKNALLKAHQRNDISSIIKTISITFRYVIQILVLVLTKNYYLFTIILVLSTLINNLITYFVVSKKYPLYICKGEVNKNIKNDIKKRVFGLVIHKLCQTSRNAFDSIFISAFIGLSMVAIYSNYYNVMYAILSLMDIIGTSILASIGNSIVTESEDKNYSDMKRFNYIYMWLSGWCTICLACLFQPFMKLWMGQEYMFPYSIVILFIIYFYMLKMGDIRSIYTDANGLWYENRYRAIIEAILNIILNFILGYYFGIYGIILGTLISLFILNFGYATIILFKYYFKNQNILEFYISHFIYAFVTFIICIITYYLCSFINIDNVLGFIIKIIICIFIPNILYLLIYFKTNIFKESFIFGKKIIKTVIKSSKN